MNTKKIGELFALLRQEDKLTQVQVAQRANVSRAIVSIVERGGGNPTMNTLMAIAHALDLEMVIEFEVKETKHG